MKQREIKFRGYDKKNKRMFPIYGIGKDFITEDTFDGVCVGCNAWDKQSETFDDVVVMQFTGLTDKNGVEIYDGDIIKGIGWIEGGGYSIDYEEEITRAIRYEDELAVFMISDDYSHPLHEWFHFLHQIHEYTLEVIGNIHEHPELLDE